MQIANIPVRTHLNHVARVRVSIRGTKIHGGNSHWLNDRVEQCTRAHRGVARGDRRFTDQIIRDNRVDSCRVQQPPNCNDDGGGGGGGGGSGFTRAHHRRIETFKREIVIEI